ncbi:Sua5 family C-terminal domain-containing protein [Microbispora triticiradicis]|uniref:Sua5 family C-terminal domain-containing protein n=1 Tax=Microbispora triticiradicis TaxID=2200763 RepID=UPI0026C62D2B|nr:Sua5 family C-terminal domain-containing protein [Microbispora triticiradicis]
MNLDTPNVLPRMCAVARRAGERARENAEAGVARRFPLQESAPPAVPWGHPDLVLLDAVAKGVISEVDAELIGMTRLEKCTLADAARQLGLTTEAAKKRRQRCEPILVDAVLSGEVEAAHPSHYAPRAQVVLVEPGKVVAEAELAQELGRQVGVFLPPSFADAPVKAHAVVAVPASMADYARGLYGFLRELDQLGCDLIVASLPAEEGLGLAIANRLRRAAGPRPSE